MLSRQQVALAPAVQAKVIELNRRSVRNQIHDERQLKAGENRATVQKTVGIQHKIGLSATTFNAGKVYDHELLDPARASMRQTSFLGR